MLLLLFIADIRAIVEDRPGTLMQDELLEHLRNIMAENREYRRKL